MKKKFVLIGLLLTLNTSLLAGCGLADIHNIVDTLQEVSDAIDEYQDKQESTKDSINLSDIFGGGATTVAQPFDVYGKYSPSPELDKASIEQPAIQIGNTVLFMNKATVQDFINAGAVTYDPDTQESDLDRIRKSSGGVALYLGDAVNVTCYFRLQDGEEIKTRDIVVESISVESKTLLLPENYQEMPDLYSIYFNDGVRYTGSLKEAVQTLGPPTSEDTSYSEDYNAETRWINYKIDNDQVRAFIEFRSLNDKLIVMTSGYHSYTNNQDGVF